jgi:hypothetical protein
VILSHWSTVPCYGPSLVYFIRCLLSIASLSSTQHIRAPPGRVTSVTQPTFLLSEDDSGARSRVGSERQSRIKVSHKTAATRTNPDGTEEVVTDRETCGMTIGDSNEQEIFDLPQGNMICGEPTFSAADKAEAMGVPFGS